MARSIQFIFVVALVLGHEISLCSAASSSTLQSALPQIVLVHGMGHGAWAWFQVTHLLESEGYIVKAIDLTSHGIDKTSASKVTTLAEYTKPLLDYLESAPGSVVLVGHSLGGGSISYAAEKLPQKVRSMIFLAAIMPTSGQSYFDSFPPKLFERLAGAGYLVVQGDNTVIVNTEKLKEFFYNQAPEQYVDLARALIVPTPYKPSSEKLILTKERYGSIPRYYLRTPNDLAITPADQDYIIAANPPTAENYIVGGDHAPFFSNPRDVAKLVSFLAKLD